MTHYNAGVVKEQGQSVAVNTSRNAPVLQVDHILCVQLQATAYF